MDKSVLKGRMFTKYEHDTDFEVYVSELLQGDLIEGPAVVGIAKQIVSKGADSLTEAQIKTFIDFGLSKGNYVEYCDRCAEEIPWSEMFLALDDHYCAYCRHLMEKDD
ncbi:hypothetical protein DFO70_11132 [Cytobacillus firmus]|uniref:Uncharacterized protein n=2 Tax=Cytobacillus TaxID=2675230 RepID=A0A366JNH4_CYTFI|nr:MULTISPECIES: hypothetical protein [Cytobacillus]RBP89385.1 hypothetical protein DFO70_11132 [Cytobacillus firmus]TDX47388.1 hypothetical protein DFO72_101485 [Cytobacillus oceanisediminis]